MNNLLQFKNNIFILPDEIGTLSLESFREELLKYLNEAYPFFDHRKYSVDLITNTEDFTIFLRGLSGINRELSYYIEKDRGFLILILSLANFLVKEGRYCECVNLIVEILGFDHLISNFLEKIYNESILNKKFHESYEIAMIFYKRSRSYTWTDNERLLMEAKWRGEADGLIHIMCSDFFRKTEGLSEDEFTDLAEENRILINIFRNNPFMNFDLLKKNLKDIAVIQPMLSFIKRLIDITYTFRERIFKNGEDLGNHFWNVITKYGSFPMAETKEEHIGYVAEYLGLEFKDIGFLFIESKKKTFEP